MNFNFFFNIPIKNHCPSFWFESHCLQRTNELYIIAVHGIYRFFVSWVLKIELLLVLLLSLHLLSLRLFLKFEWKNNEKFLLELNDGGSKLSPLFEWVVFSSSAHNLRGFLLRLFLLSSWWDFVKRYWWIFVSILWESWEFLSALLSIFISYWG